MARTSSIRTWRWNRSTSGAPSPPGPSFLCSTAPASSSSSRPREDYVDRTIEVHRRLKLPTEILDRRAARPPFPPDRFRRDRARPVRAAIRSADGAALGPDPGRRVRRRGRRISPGERSCRPTSGEAGRWRGISSSSGGEHLSADRYVFACGPWLPKLFPALLGRRIFPTRQEIFFFAPQGRRHALCGRKLSRLGRFQRWRHLLRLSRSGGPRSQDRP